MRLYVCWDTAEAHPVLGEHPCGIAYRALRGAGYDPEVKRADGWTKLAGIFNQTPGRREVRQRHLDADDLRRRLRGVSP